MKADLEPDLNARTPTQGRDELDLLLHWERPEPRRTLWSAIGSLLAHLVGLSVVTVVGFGPGHPSPDSDPLLAGRIDERQAVTLVTPRDIVTQKAPNVAKPADEVDLAGLTAPPDAVRASRPSFRPPTPKRGLPVPQIQPAAPEAPKIEAAPQIAQAPPPAFGNIPGVAPPIQPPPSRTQAEKPKLTFESIGSNMGSPQNSGQIAAPKASLEDTVKGAIRRGPGGVVVGDSGDSGVSGLANPAAQQARQSSLELLSDPQGVDFRPYLSRVLAAVRRNWFAVMPESVRMGQRGRTTIQFAISKQGNVPKLVISGPSGVDHLDRAAVAGISASNPFPPLPAEYPGQQIQLQLSFSYNMPAR